VFLKPKKDHHFESVVYTQSWKWAKNFILNNPPPMFNIDRHHYAWPSHCSAPEFKDKFELSAVEPKMPCTISSQTGQL